MTGRAVADWFYGGGHVLVKVVFWIAFFSLCGYLVTCAANEIDRLHTARIRAAEACQASGGILLKDALERDVCARAVKP
jgi:hypothetical protein